MDYRSFVDCRKSLLVSPAGYGKTFTIVECLKHSTGRNLILTHTHAGVASIKNKIKELPEIKSSQYRIETISSFAQRFVKAFYMGADKPEDEQSNEYYQFNLDQAIRLFAKSPVQEVLKVSYSGLFVDEYQDCTYPQHVMIMQLSDIFPTHILCDPFQGIFDFHRTEDWNFIEHLDQFCAFPELDVPQRWKQEGSNSDLGDSFHDIRIELKNSRPIELSNYRHCCDVNLISEREKYQPGSAYNNSIRDLMNNDVLFIDPSSANEKSREKFVKAFRSTVLLERFDHPIYFDLSRLIDSIEEIGIEQVIRDVVQSSYSSKGFNNWFNQTGFKNKRGQQDIGRIEEVRILINLYHTPSDLREILRKIHQLPQMHCFRLGRIRGLLKACDNSVLMKSSVYASMKEQRANLRHLGRVIRGKSIGTTLLTKGLEFETVAILDAHKFDCPKHLYVAMTRACKKLVIFTENITLSPYPEAGQN